jgi:hypothetical protein
VLPVRHLWGGHVPAEVVNNYGDVGASAFEQYSSFSILAFVDIQENVPSLPAGRSLQRKLPSTHLALLGKSGGHCPPPFPQRTAFPVHGARRTARFFRMPPPRHRSLRPSQSRYMGEPLVPV